MIRPLGGGHLGSAVSALVDGQLDPATAERAWRHVQDCPHCRVLVERESWVKKRVSSMSGTEPSARLLGSLYELRETGEAWAAVDALERRGRGRRRAGLALLGAGSVSAAVFGVASLGAPVLGIGGSSPTGPPTASLTTPTSARVGTFSAPGRGGGLDRPGTTGGATSSSGSAFSDVAPVVSVHGHLPRAHPVTPLLSDDSTEERSAVLLTRP